MNWSDQKPLGYVLVGRVTSSNEPHLTIRSHVILNPDAENNLFCNMPDASNASKRLPVQDLCGKDALAPGEVLSVNVHEVIVNPTPGPRIMEIRK